MSSGFLFAGLSADLAAAPDSALRVQLMGKPVLLTRDSQGAFHAFEDDPSADASADVGLSSRHLVELPAGERCGILFVVSHPQAGVDYAAALGDVLGPELERELGVRRSRSKR